MNFLHRNAHMKHRRVSRMLQGCSWNFLVVHYYLMSLTFKFQKDPSFCCGDICLTILTFVESLIFIVFCILSKFELQSSCQIWKIQEPPWNFSKHNFKMLGSQWKKYTSPSSQFLGRHHFRSSLLVGWMLLRGNQAHNQKFLNRTFE